MTGALWMTRLAAFAVALLGVATSSWGQTPGPVLVLPFDNVEREPRIYWMGEGAAVLLADELVERGADALTRGEREEAFERLHLPPVVSLSQATMIKVGQLLGASEIISGRLQLADNRLTVTARSVTLATGRARIDVSESGPLEDLFSIFGRLAARLVSSSNPTAVDEAATRTRLPSVHAFEQYVKGLLAEAPEARIKFLNAALKIAPSYDAPRLALWQAYTDQGEHQQALDAVRRVAVSSRLSRRARFLGILTQIELKQYEQAHDGLQELAREEPTAAVYNNLGVVQLRRGATAQMGLPAYYFTQAADRAPADADYCFNLGYAYWIARDSKAAVYWLREAVRRDPADGDAHFILGTVLQAVEPGIEATREKELARQLSSKYDEWQRGSGVPDHALRGLERLKQDPDTPRIAQMDAAIVSTVQREQRQVAGYHLEAGRRLFAEEKNEEAMAEIRRALFLSPYLSEAQLLLGRIYRAAGRFPEAIDAFKVSIWSEETAAARLALGGAYLESGDVDAARTEAERARVLDPASPDAKRLLDEIAQRQKNEPQPR